MNKSKPGREVSKHEAGVDLMSNLPDAILLLILSKLKSTEEAIRSSILSKRWRYLWTAVPSLDLGIGRFRYKKSKFKEFVYWVLLNRSVDLDCFRLHGWDDYRMSTVERWIHATVMRNVKQLDLMFNPKEENGDMPPIVMPHCLVTCASLEVLSLSSGARLILPNFSGFPSLRVLKLENVDLFDDVNYFLESCCPLLEDLMFHDCWLDRLDLLCISCPNLKKLRISKFYKEDDDLCDCLKLSCTTLVSLDLTGQIASNYIVERLHSLKEADIDSDSKTEHQLLLGISHVESLTIDLHFLYEEYDYLKFPKLDETEIRWILTPEVKWIEFFEFNGEKPKLDISWYGIENKSEWAYIAARWGNKAKYSH